LRLRVSQGLLGPVQRRTVDAEGIPMVPGVQALAAALPALKHIGEPFDLTRTRPAMKHRMILDRAVEALKTKAAQRRTHSKSSRTLRGPQRIRSVEVSARFWSAPAGRSGNNPLNTLNGKEGGEEELGAQSAEFGVKAKNEAGGPRPEVRNYPFLCNPWLKSLKNKPH
jgi:hypothetical protein